MCNDVCTSGRITSSHRQMSSFPLKNCGKSVNFSNDVVSQSSCVSLVDGQKLIFKQITVVLCIIVYYYNYRYFCAPRFRLPTICCQNVPVYTSAEHFSELNPVRSDIRMCRNRLLHSIVQSELLSN